MEIETLMRHLSPSLIEQTLVTGTVDSGEVDYLDLQASDLRVIRVAGLGRSIRLRDDIKTFMRVRNLMARTRPDIVHTHTAKAGVIGRLAAASIRKRPFVIHSYHGHVLSGYFPKWANLLVRLIERLLGIWTDVFIAVGPEVRTQLLAAGIGRPQDFQVIEPGVSLSSDWTRESARKSYGLDDSTFVICFVGRLVQIKRPDRMIEVVRQVASRGVEIQVLVAGGGDLEAATRQAALQANLPIQFLGWVDDVERVFRASDLALLTSDNEGTPISLVQAGLAGVPAVATDVGSVSHVVRDLHSGWLTSTEAGQIADAVISAVSAKQALTEFGAKAAEHMHEHFSVQAFLTKHESVYRQVVASNGERR